jgi:hypothetical protein
MSGARSDGRARSDSRARSRPVADRSPDDLGAAEPRRLADQSADARSTGCRSVGAPHPSAKPTDVAHSIENPARRPRLPTTRYAGAQIGEARREPRARQGGVVVRERRAPQRVDHVLQRAIARELVPAGLATAHMRFHTPSGGGAGLVRGDAQEVRLDGAAHRLPRAHDRDSIPTGSSPSRLPAPDLAVGLPSTSPRPASRCIRRTRFSTRSSVASKACDLFMALSCALPGKRRRRTNVSRVAAGMGSVRAEIEGIRAG